jgi:DNA-directed RNA polymerase subunit omega
MARVTVEDCLVKVRNRFELVHVAVKRTKQILNGSKPLVDYNNRPPVLALREIAEGMVKPILSEPDNSSEEIEKDESSTTD